MREALKMIQLKAALRADMRQRLRAMTAEDRQLRSALIRDHVLKLTVWKQGKTIVFFSPMQPEPEIASLAQIAAAAGKSTAIIPSTTRVEAELGLPDHPDLIFVPGLAFSKDRHRLGRGDGFFDRLLAGRTAKAFKMGILFRFKSSIHFQPSVTISSWTRS